ncbi:glycosyltransferase family 4 protein [Patescibacteria group bacterium]|nr:glycosyltransferase family 4 protein [Patescibacteria group bacterium]MDE1946798.1 glycosyltransferase family 4 protein [Patescibacteria group bacterium]MDE2011136.1 glycosyltransferase family 4 protein [Patescibacteria group bacterium]MDE2233045.1 glycosyltransferase family 4 protein [Patescibacteria group bacterium]
MKILIATGIYPPDIGGPAQYARNLYETWKNAKGADGKPLHRVKVAAYRWERAFPPGVRHLLYLLKVIRKGWDADLILVLDTWSAAMPAMHACNIMHKKYVIRTGGDFLWETYAERTGDLVRFKNFYGTRMEKFSRKEKLIFRLGGQALRKAKVVIFSTAWQKEIFEKAYGLDPRKSAIVENYCGERLEPTEPENRAFVAATRPLKWKNVELLKEAFEAARVKVKKAGLQDIELDTGKAVYDSFVEKIRHSYAVILASLGDISPNMIFDAIRAGTPFILTKETGIAERVKDCAVFVDPEDENEIADKITWLSEPGNRARQAELVRKFSWKHSWREIADEIVAVWEKF